MEDREAKRQAVKGKDMIQKLQVTSTVLSKSTAAIRQQTGKLVGPGNRIGLMARETLIGEKMTYLEVEGGQFRQDPPQPASAHGPDGWETLRWSLSLVPS